jgi:hypothetical protein
MAVVMSMTTVIQVMIKMMMRAQISGKLQCEPGQQIIVFLSFQSGALICNFQSRN